MKLIRTCFYALFFLTPLAFSPLNFELFEFPKMILVYLLTIIIVSSWLIYSIKQKRLIFRKTPLDIPILLFLISQILSTIYSINTRTSLIGYYSRFNQGLFSTLSYITLYYAFVTFMNKKALKKSLNLLLTSGALVTLYAIAQHFGIDSHLWVQDVQNRVFSTLGQPNWLAAFIVSIIFIPISLYLKTPKPIYVLLFSIFYLSLLYTKSRSGILSLAISYTLFWTLILYIHNKIRFKHIKKPLILFTTLVILLSLFDGLGWLPQINKIMPFTKTANKTATTTATTTTNTTTKNQQQIVSPGGTESGDIRKIVWQGAINVWRQYPILGSGVETFAYSYYNFRPIEHNLVSEWDFVYNKAHNEYLNYLATTGIVGLFTYLIFQISFIAFLLKNLNKTTSALLAGYIGLSITNFFGFSTVLTSLLIFQIPAIAIVFKSFHPTAQQTQNKLSFPQKLLSFITLLFTLTLLLTTLRWAIADAYFAKGSRNLDYNLLSKAHRLMPKEPNFSAKLAEVSATKYLTDKNPNLGEQAIVLAETTKLQNPVHLKFVKSYTRVYLTLSQANPAFLDDAAKELIRGTKLSPTDAKLRYNLGLIYIQQDNFLEAEKHLKAAIALKPNYDTARYALGVFYQDQNQPQKARQQYQYILDFISPQNQNVIDRLNSLN